MHISQQMATWHDELVGKGIIPAQALALSHRIDSETMLAGRCAASYKITSVEPTDGELFFHAAIFRQYPKINTIITAQQPCTMTVSRTSAKRLYPLLDDFTQIVGVSVRHFDPSLYKGNMLRAAAAVVRAFKGRNAVMLHAQGALCGAHDFDEACAVALVLEKNCKALIEASFLGGGKTINVFESLLMRFVYQKKYSKIAAKKV